MKVGRVLAEFALIVVGVLAALAVDEIRTSRGERVQERFYLDGLARDLNFTERNIQYTARHHSWVLGHATRVLPVLRNEEPVPEDTATFLMSVYQASRSLEPTVSRATFDELMSTGSLRLIREDSLRVAVVGYYQAIERSLWPVAYERDRDPYRTVVRSLFPISVQTVARTCFSDRNEEQCRGALDGTELAPLLRSVLARKDLSEDLTLSMQSMVARNFALRVDRTREIRLRIEGELDDLDALDSTRQQP